MQRFIIGNDLIFESVDAAAFVVVMAGVVPFGAERPVAPFVLCDGGKLCAVTLRDDCVPTSTRGVGGK